MPDWSMSIGLVKFELTGKITGGSGNPKTREVLVKDGQATLALSLKEFKDLMKIGRQLEEHLRDLDEEEDDDDNDRPRCGCKKRRKYNNDEEPDDDEEE